MTTPPGRVTPEQLYGPMGTEDNLIWERFTVPFDFSGAPTLSLPCGQNDEVLRHHGLDSESLAQEIAKVLAC